MNKLITDKTQISNKTELNRFLSGMKESERFGWLMDNWDIVQKVAPDAAAIVEGSFGDLLKKVCDDLGSILESFPEAFRDISSQAKQAKDKPANKATDLRADRVRQALSQAHTKSKEYASKDST